MSNVMGRTLVDYAGRTYLDRPFGNNDLPASRILPHLRELVHVGATTDPLVTSRDADGTLQVAYPSRVDAAADGWALHLPWATNPLPMNRSGRTSGWRARQPYIRKVRETAYTLALHRIPRQARIRVRLDWEVTDRRTRDEDNLGDTLKRLVDGLKLAGVVDDDNRAHVLRDFPEIHYAPKGPDRPEAFMRLWVWRVDPSDV